MDCEVGIDKDGEVGERVEPYYVQDCISREEGQCNTAAVGVRSILIGNTVNAYEQPREGTCRSFAYEGDGARVGVWGLGVVLGCAVVIMEVVL
jgi:hypothetical protein